MRDAVASDPPKRRLSDRVPLANNVDGNDTQRRIQQVACREACPAFDGAPRNVVETVKSRLAAGASRSVELNRGLLSVSQLVALRGGDKSRTT